MRIVSVYALFGNSAEAERIARIVVEERLAACANLIAPVRSIYRWQGSVETSDEVATIFKTTDERVDALIARIAALHSYDVPCIATWPIGKILGSYAEWVENSVA